MQSTYTLESADVVRILEASCAEAQVHNWNVTVAVVDEGGHLLGLQRLDGAAPISASIAAEKARSAALGRRETKGFEDMVNGGRTAFLSAPLLTSLEGGVPVIIAGKVIGAVGVSGVQAHQDAQIAKAGIAAIVGSASAD